MVSATFGREPGCCRRRLRPPIALCPIEGRSRLLQFDTPAFEEFQDTLSGLRDHQTIDRKASRSLVPIGDPQPVTAS